MTTLIAANAAAATSAAFTMSGEGKIIARLTGNETVNLLEEYPDGTYLPVVNDNGIIVQLTAAQPSRVFVGYGNYKVVKTATATAIAVGLES